MEKKTEDDGEEKERDDVEDVDMCPVKGRLWRDDKDKKC